MILYYCSLFAFKEEIMSNFEVKVPATIANLGPGFDCLGMAIDIWNSVTAKVGQQKIIVDGFGKNSLPKDQNNLIYISICKVFEKLQYKVPKLTIECHNTIPIQKGLGSSAASIISGLLLGNALCNNQLIDTEILQLANEIEGHADNAAACLFGGCQIVVKNNNGLISNSKLNVPEDLELIIFVPDKTTSTDDSRKIIPQTINLQDAVFNIGRTALLVNLLNNNINEPMKLATEDKIHQPYRLKSLPGLDTIIQTSIKSGALGSFLCGSGPAIMTLTKSNVGEISNNIKQAASNLNIPGQIILSKPTSTGAYSPNNN